MYEKVQGHAIAERPAIDSLPLREALMEVLVRLSLEDAQKVSIPTELQEHITAIAQLVRSVQQVDASVEDTAEATIRIYDIVSQIPNIPADPEELQEQDLSDMGQEGEREQSQELQMGASGRDGSPEGEEQDYKSPQQVDFRGEFKPELAQMLANLRDQPSKADTDMEVSGVSEEELRQMLEKSVEIELSEVQEGELDQATGMFVDNLMNEAAKQRKKRSPTPSSPTYLMTTSP